MTKPDGIIYLASPYSHPDPAVVEARVAAVTRLTAQLTLACYTVFSPIVHSHPLTQFAALPCDWAYWQRHDEYFVRASSELWVALISGWQESVGVRAEIELARRYWLPVRGVHLHEDGSYRITADLPLPT